jgi:hypothetical protein
MNDETRAERAFTELFHRLPVEPLPLGFRDTVMSRITASASASSRWEWVVAAVIAIPSGLFLLWSVLENGDDFAAAFSGFGSALLGLDEWDASSSIYVDGLVLVAVALVGIAGLLVTHALLTEEPRRGGALAA